MGQLSILLPSSISFVSTFLHFIRLKGESAQETIKATKITENFSLARKSSTEGLSTLSKKIDLYLKKTVWKLEA